MTDCRRGVCLGGRHVHAADRSFSRAYSRLRTSLAPTWPPGSAGGPPPPQEGFSCLRCFPPSGRGYRHAAARGILRPHRGCRCRLRQGHLRRHLNRRRRCRCAARGRHRQRPSITANVVNGPSSRSRVARGKHHLLRCRRHRRRLLSRPTLLRALPSFREGQTSSPSSPHSSRPTCLKALPPPGEAPRRLRLTSSRVLVQDAV